MPTTALHEDAPRSFRKGDAVIVFKLSPVHERPSLRWRGRIIRKIHPTYFEVDCTHNRTDRYGGMWGERNHAKDRYRKQLVYASELAHYVDDDAAKAEQDRWQKQWREDNPDKAKAYDKSQAELSESNRRLTIAFNEIMFGKNGRLR